MSRTTRRLRDEMRTATRPPFFLATVTAISTGDRTITVQETSTASPMVLPAAMDAYPAVGSTALVLMNGDEPVVFGQLGAGGGMLSSIPTGVPSVADLTGLTPSSFQPPAPVVFLEADQKLYRWDGAAWTAAVPTVDLDGLITGTQIDDGAISTPKLAANAVTANELAADAVTANKILAGEVDVSKLAANSVTAAKLAAIDLEVGKYLRSTSYVAGDAGWSIDADGSAEFNDVTVRGRLAASVVEKSDDVAFYAGLSTFGSHNDLANGTFDVDVSGWTGSNCALARVTSPVKAGAGAMRMTASAAGTMTATSPTGTGGVDISAYPGAQWTVTAWIRTAATSRQAKLNVLYYDAAGSLLTTWAGGVEGMVTSVNDSTTYTAYTARATAPPAAQYLAARITIGGAATSEVHYVDSVSITDLEIGFCADVDPNGAYILAEGIGSAYVLPPGYVGVEGSGGGVQAVVGGYPNMGTVSPVTAGLAYTVSSLMTTYEASTPMLVRAYAAWYTTAGALIGVDRGRGYYSDSTLATLVEGDFKAPPGAAYVFFGVAAEPGATPTGKTISCASVELYQTTDVQNGYISPDSLASGAGVIAPGFAMPYFGPVGTMDEPVPGWVVGDGRAVSRTKYSALFAVFGATHGAGDGSTTFNVPDLRGRVPVPLDNMGGTDAGRLSMANTLGGTGGEEQHTLTAAEMPSHSHTLYGNNTTGTGSSAYGEAVMTVASGSNNKTSGPAGSGGAHNNMPPYILCNWLIKT